MRLLIATTNAGKLAELSAMLADLPGLTVVGLSELPRLPPVVEDGETFEANARKKALACARATGLPTLADDSGLEVDALGGAPGVRSARYAGEDASDADNNRKLLAALAGVPEAKRTARFRAVLALVLPAPEAGPNREPDPEPEIHTVQGTLEGRIATAPSGTGGFGYDPLFLPEGHNQTLAELGPAHKNTISHRARALENLHALLEKALRSRQA